MNNGSFVNHVAAGQVNYSLYDLASCFKISCCLSLLKLRSPFQMNSGEGLQDDGDLLLPTEPIGHTAMPQEAIFVPAPPSQALVLPTSVAAPQQHSIFASDQPFREVRPVATYAQNQPQMEAPSRTPASSGPASSSGGRRPMRQSRLRHRNFDLELEEEEQEEEEFYKPKGGKKGAQVQRPQSAAFEPKRAPIVRQRPSPPQQQVALAAPRMMPFCVIDLPCPRRGRSVGGTRPRSGRASMNRLKQAAHGNLPIGGNPALVLMGGNASPAASAGRGDFR